MAFIIGTPRRAASNPTPIHIMWPDTPYAHLMIPIE
jgi:hypothetical protein